MDGTMPTQDENGVPLQGNRARYTGQPIANGFRRLFVQFIMSGISCDLHLFWIPSITTRIAFFCCGATKSPGPACAWDYSSTPGWSHTMTDSDKFQAARVGNVLCELPGFHVNGTVLWELVLQGRWGAEQTPWKQTRGVQFEGATKEFQPPH